jgi:hypothetical protein
MMCPMRTSKPTRVYVQFTSAGNRKNNECVTVYDTSVIELRDLFLKMIAKRAQDKFKRSLSPKK